MARRTIPHDPRDLEQATVAELQKGILGWYAANARDLPWRRTTDPYAILISEIMLQQTQAPRVIPKFAEFLACLLYTSPSPRDRQKSRMPSSA